MIEWLIEGNTEQHIVEAFHKNFPGLDLQQALQLVETKLAEEGRPNSDAVRGWILMSLRELYRKMFEIGDFDGARKALKEISTIVK